MNKIIMAVKSRTVWTVVAMVLVNGITSIQSMIPAQYLPIVNGVLGLLAVYFRINPQQ